MNPGFKQTTIKKILRDRIEDWLSTIPDEALRLQLKKDCLITGGAITSLLLGEKPNDYDVYFKNFETAYVAAEHYVTRFNQLNLLKTKVDRNIQPSIRINSVENIKGETEKRIQIYMKSAGVAAEGQDAYTFFESQPDAVTDDFVSSLDNNELVEGTLETVKDIATKADVTVSPNPKAVPKPRFRPIFLTDNAITLSNSFQLIIRFYGEPDVIHRNFDFVHATCYYDYSTNQLHCSQEALLATLSRSLVYVGSLYPIASVFRIRKFLERGWRINAGQLLKILFQVNEINMKDPVVLKEQLIGVDMAYFHQVLALLKQAPNGKIDAAYLSLILDKVFE